MNLCMVSCVVSTGAGTFEMGHNRDKKPDTKNMKKSKDINTSF